MRILGLSIGLLLAPVAPSAAQERMNADLCARGWLAFSQALEGLSQPAEVQQDITPFGWCRAAGGQPGFDDVHFNEMRWRTNGLEVALEAGLPPLGLWAELDEFDFQRTFRLKNLPGAGFANGNVSLALRQDPEARVLDLDHLSIDMGDMGKATLMAALRQVNLSSPADMQMSLGAAAVTELTAEVFSNGLAGKAIWPNVMENQPAGKSDAEVLRQFRAQVDMVLQALPTGMLSTADRAAVTALVDDLPDARGVFRITLRSETGFGLPHLLVLGVALKQVETGRANPTDLQSKLAPLFKDVAVEISWKPVR